MYKFYGDRNLTRQIWEYAVRKFLIESKLRVFLQLSFRWFVEISESIIWLLSVFTANVFTAELLTTLLKFFCPFPEFFCSKSESDRKNLFYSKNCFSPKRPVGHVEGIFDKPAEIVFPGSWLFRSVYENDRKISFVSRNQFPSNCSPGHSDWITDNLAKKFAAKGGYFFRRKSQKMIKRTFLSKIFIEAFFCTPNMNFRHMCWNFLP